MESSPKLCYDMPSTRGDRKFDGSCTWVVGTKRGLPPLPAESYTEALTPSVTVIEIGPWQK